MVETAWSRSPTCDNGDVAEERLAGSERDDLSSLLVPSRHAPPSIAAP